MMPSWVGTARVATTNTNNALRPRKRRRAKANPASVENSTVETVTTPPTITLLLKALQNSTLSKTRRALAMKFPPGSIGGTFWGSIDGSRLATRNDQYSGNAEPSRNAISRPYTPNLALRSTKRWRGQGGMGQPGT